MEERFESLSSSYPAEATPQWPRVTIGRYDMCWCRTQELERPRLEAPTPSRTRTDAGRTIQDQTGREVIYVKTDISKRPSVRAMVGATLKELGRIDVLINNAAVEVRKRIDDITDEH